MLLPLSLAYRVGNRYVLGGLVGGLRWLRWEVAFVSAMKCGPEEIAQKLGGPGAGTIWDHLRGSRTQQEFVNEAAAFIRHQAAEINRLRFQVQELGRQVPQ